MISFRIPDEQLEGWRTQFADQINQLDHFKNRLPRLRDALHAKAQTLQSFLSSELTWNALPAPTGSAIHEMYASKARTSANLEGTQQVLADIRAHWDSMEFGIPWLKQVHGRMGGHRDAVSGDWKRKENKIFMDSVRGEGTFETIPAAETDAVMHQLHADFDDMWEQWPDLRVLLIAVYRFNFICIHPFYDGNGRASRLSATLLLYKTGHSLCDLWNLEDAMYRKRLTEFYYNTRLKTEWHSREYPAEVYVQYWLDLLVDGYRSLESKNERLEQAIRERSVGIVG